MRIAFVRTYPIYHDLEDPEAWLQRETYVRRIPGILAEMGHTVEFWAAARSSGGHQSKIDGLGDYPIRFFESVEASRATKKHHSDALVEYARAFDADLHLLKGTDGGVGLHLIRSFLAPQDRPFVFIIGGKYYTRHVPRAEVVFYETEEQRRMLRGPGWYMWRTPVPDERLLRMPKSVDTKRFRPMPDVDPAWDIVSVGRLVPRIKNYDALGQLSGTFDVAVVGDGPARTRLERSYPEIDWVGPVPHPEVATMMNRGRLFMHPSYREYAPRVIAEAAACGTPVLAFAHAIAPDVLPPGCGLRLDQKYYEDEIGMLLDDADLIEAMGARARSYAVEHLGKEAVREALEQMIRRVDPAERPSSA